MLNKLCKISAHSAQRFGGHFRNTHGEGVHPLHWRGLRPNAWTVLIIFLTRYNNQSIFLMCTGHLWFYNTYTVLKQMLWLNSLFSFHVVDWSQEGTTLAQRPERRASIAGESSRGRPRHILSMRCTITRAKTYRRTMPLHRQCLRRYDASGAWCGPFDDWTCPGVLGKPSCQSSPMLGIGAGVHAGIYSAVSRLPLYLGSEMCIVTGAGSGVRRRAVWMFTPVQGEWYWIIAWWGAGCCRKGRPHAAPPPSPSQSLSTGCWPETTPHTRCVSAGGQVLERDQGRTISRLARAQSLYQRSLEWW